MKLRLRMKMGVKSGDVRLMLGGSRSGIRGSGMDVMACMWHVGRMLRSPGPVPSTGQGSSTVTYVSTSVPFLVDRDIEVEHRQSVRMLLKVYCLDIQFFGVPN